jgi:hypothetical protein
MAILKSTCPHCVTHNIALMVTGSFNSFDDYTWAIFLKCPKCLMPTCAVLHDTDGDGNWDPGDLKDSAGDPTDHGWTIIGFWPEPAKPLIPENLPKNVERIYLQAERNFPVQGNEEAAGTMYRKALDVGLKEFAPDVRGSLADRIKKLAADNKLTTEIAEWSTHVRVLGNEAAHDDEPPSRADLTDLRNFSEMVMRYLFSLPAMVAARKPPVTSGEP